MNICPVCNNDNFTCHGSDDMRMLVCTVCGEDFFDDSDDYEEVDIDDDDYVDIDDIY